MAARHLTGLPSTFKGAPGAELYDLGRGPETTPQRVRRLQNEARMLAREQVEQLARDLETLAARAVEIAEGGDAYPAGVRDLARRFVEDTGARVQTLEAITARA